MNLKNNSNYKMFFVNFANKKLIIKPFKICNIRISISCFYLKYAERNNIDVFPNHSL